LSDAEIIAFERNGPNSRVVSSVKIGHRGDLCEIAAEKFVICTGTIDSNLLVLAHQHSLGVLGQEGLGGRLHDHLSLPLFKIYIRGARSRFRNLIAPRFERGMIFGRRFELRSERGGGWGFLHFQFMSDDVSPYREIKKLLLLRQQAAGALVISKAVLPV